MGIRVSRLGVVAIVLGAAGLGCSAITGFGDLDFGDEIDASDPDGGAPDAGDLEDAGEPDGSGLLPDGGCEGCTILRRCIASGTVHPDGCGACLPLQNRNEWSPFDVGIDCDDRDFCTSSSTCDGSLGCVPGGLTCDDRLSCTEDLCTAADTTCGNRVREGFCLVEGKSSRLCAEDGDPNPDNECEECDGLVSDRWSERPDNAPCGAAGLQICCEGRCSAVGCTLCGAGGC